jgi:phosphoenolpyruvate carboxylase
VAADGKLTDVLRNVSAFGLTLIPLDVRQESDRHEEALDAITRFLGKGSYAQWDEKTRISWMTKEISSTRPLLRAGVWHEYPEVFSPTTVDTLETFRMIAEQHEDSLGAYVISQATSASDILAVLLLQRDAGVKKPLRVAPLFETLDDLNGAAATMKSLFSTPVYMGLIEGKQEVMIGYSDSAKDAGRLAASWAQYEKQEELAQVARDFSVDMTFFHGKGGTVGRGGNPQTFHAIMSHAPDTINGKFRVTEQGEMINQNFGYDDRATRTMDIYTAAILAEKLTKRPKPPQVWRDMMNKLSARSVEAYRKIVFKDERFVAYFRAATPELELSNLNIGSRPAKRKATGGVESLRAIPWIFAWTQTRFNLPTWLGVGEALGEVLEKEEKDAVVLKEMYRDWDSFRTMIDLVEMVLAKSEPSIAKHYDDVLVKDEKAKELGVEVRNIHLATERTILSLTEHEKLSENNTILLRALLVRNPYVDCLNVLQAETLKRLRDQEEGKDDLVLKDALLTTITGIANGMGNTG